MNRREYIMRISRCSQDFRNSKVSLMSLNGIVKSKKGSDYYELYNNFLTKAMNSKEEITLIINYLGRIFMVIMNSLPRQAFTTQLRCQRQI